MEEKKEAPETAKDEFAELEKVLATPIGKDELEKAMADAAVERAQALVMRMKLVARQNAYRQAIAEAQTMIDEIDVRLATVQVSESILFRRRLNPEVGEPVSTAK